MICTFCGTENPGGNRFCGICGVRLERRKAERRTEPRSNTTCAECGHVNEGQYKFCGMCGARIDRRVQERRVGELSRANASANAQLPTPQAHKPPARREPETVRRSAVTSAAGLADRERSYGERTETLSHEVSASVSGPSFLGLNDSQAGAEYLLEDERSSHRGLRTLLLLIVVAAIVGLILVQYRSSINGNSKSPQPPNPSPATIPRSEGQDHPPGWDHGLQTAMAAHSLQPAVASLAKAASLSPNTAATAKNQNAGEDDGSQPERAAGGKADPPAPLSTRPNPTLVKAQKYLHGQGVRQNCEQGLIYLKAAARENDPQAAVQMGALYSSGLCVARNRVQAYEWFSTARDMQPDNHWIARNLDVLWAQMTPTERRQIRQ